MPIADRDKHKLAWCDGPCAHTVHNRARLHNLWQFLMVSYKHDHQVVYHRVCEQGPGRVCEQGLSKIARERSCCEVCGMTLVLQCIGANADNDCTFLRL